MGSFTEFQHASATTENNQKQRETNMADSHTQLSRNTGSFRFPRISFAPIGSSTVQLQTWRRKIVSAVHGGCSFCEQIMLMRITASWFLFLFIGPFRYVGCVETKERGKTALFVSNMRF